MNIVINSAFSECSHEYSNINYALNELYIELHVLTIVVDEISLNYEDNRMSERCHAGYP